MSDKPENEAADNITLRWLGGVGAVVLALFVVWRFAERVGSGDVPREHAVSYGEGL